LGVAHRLAHLSRNIEALLTTKMDLILTLGYAVHMNRLLTEEQAQSIIDRVAGGEPQKKLAAEFGAKPSTISNLIRGKSWPNLRRPDPPAVVIRGCKLTPKDIPRILTRLAAMETPAAIALDYGVTRQAIADIRMGKTWSHIPRPSAPKPRKKVWEQ